MEIVEKSATVTPVESESDFPGEFEVILSTEDLDRDKENLWADEWKQPLPDRIHIDGDHGRNIEKTVGSAVPRLEDGKLVAHGTYAGTEYAQMVRQLVKEGHINSLSVTYSESKNQKDDGVQRELLNAAFVAIPANPKAVVLSSKSAKLSEKDQNDFLSVIQSFYSAKAAGGLSASGDNPKVPPHDAMVQAIHDAAAHLGAMCMNEIDADPGTADGANKSVDEESSSSKDAGSPEESADESAAPAAAEKSAAADAAEESAEATAAVRAKEAEKARALAWLISQNTKDV